MKYVEGNLIKKSARNPSGVLIRPVMGNVSETLISELQFDEKGE